jgi:tetratricopeptide (TPR) repeat protein
MQDSPPTFLDVNALLEQGERPRGSNAWYFVGGLLVAALLMAYATSAAGTQSDLVQIVLPVLALLLVVAGVVSSLTAVRRHRSEQRQLEAVEAFVQLRSWPEAAVAVEGLLQAQPRNPAVRVQGLIFLASVLARYGRYNDAVAVHDFLLEHVALDPSMSYGLRVGRTMAMLHEDHLFDADRAIGELRRLGDRNDSAGLALVEIYRDVKTGHPNEAIAIFEQRLALLRDKLGHRVADAYALVARAYELVGNEDAARQAWQRATLLAPAIELVRRYPQVAKTAERFPAAAAPAGM